MVSSCAIVDAPAADDDQPADAAADDADAFVAAFLQQRLHDRALGIERSLDDYLQRFPGHAAAIRAAWRASNEAGEAQPAAEVPPIAAIGPH